MLIRLVALASAVNYLIGKISALTKTIIYLEGDDCLNYSLYWSPYSGGWFTILMSSPI